MKDLTPLKRLDLPALASKYGVKIKGSGNKTVGICPFHNDKKHSLTFFEDNTKFKCFACGEAGDAIDFVSKLTGVGFKEATEAIESDVLLSHIPKAHAPKPEAATWQIVTRRSKSHPKPTFEHYKYGKPSAQWKYNDFFYVCRFDTPDGKEVMPYTLCKLDGRTEWRWKGHPTPRPLYNLQALKDNPDSIVIVVEGEKTADALSSVMNGVVVVTWVGGANGMPNTNFEPLQGRKLLYWPDHDWQGYAAMYYINSVVTGEAKYISAPSDAPLHWDFADTGWNRETTREFIKGNKNDFKPFTEPQSWVKDAEGAVHFNIHGREGAIRVQGGKVSPFGKPADAAPTEPPKAPEAPKPKKKRPYYTHIGYGMNSSGGIEHFVYDDRAKKVHTFSPSKMTKNNFIQIAPLNYWEGRYPTQKGGADWDAAVDSFTDSSMRAGLYNNDRIRGRGAWIDKGRIVIHSGSHLIVDGSTVPTDEIESKFVYQIDHPTGFEVGQPLLKRDSAQLIKALKLVSWQRDVNAHLLAGWLVLAPLGGALDWRPHVWVTGPRGAGKTWIKREIIDRILGDAIVNAIGETTEAGLRQTLSSDSLPVVFDEIDSDTKKDNDRIEQIMTLMRIASSESGAKVYKGTTAHQSRSFNIRSCFCFLSIVYQAARAADLSRITVLTVQEDKSLQQDARFTELQAIVRDDFTESWVKGLRARTLDMLPIILANIKVFEKASRVILKSSRARDQIAPLMAGAYSLVSDGEISLKDAEKFLSAHTWEDELASEETNDETKCLDKIMQHTVKLELEYKQVDRTVGELIANCMGGGGPDGHTSAERLLRMGIKIDGRFIIISNTADGVRGALRDTPWTKNHGKVLQRIEGAEACDVMRFSSGHRSRAVKIKWEG